MYRSLACFLILLFIGGTNQLSLAQTNFISNSSYNVVLDDCEAVGEVCIDFPQGLLPTYSISVDGMPFMGAIDGCAYDTIYVYSYAGLFGEGEWGPYYLESWTVNDSTFSGEFMVIADLVDSMNVWDPTGNWTLLPDVKKIIGGNFSSVYTFMEVNVVQINAVAVLGYNPGSEPLGTAFYFEQGTHELVFTEILTGMTDTVFIYAACPQQDLDTLILQITDTELYCPSNEQLSGNIVNIYNHCAVTSSPVIYSFDEDCVSITGIDEGATTACLVACDEAGFCDTTFLSIQVEAPDLEVFTFTETLTIPVYQEAEYCYNVSGLNGNIIEINNLCQSFSGEAVLFEAIDNATYCLNYNAINLGTDTVCYSFITDANQILNTTLIVEVTPPISNTITDTLLIGQEITYCMDFSELNGDIATFFNDCESFSGNSVIFGTNNVSLCIETSAVAIGTEQACIIFCDESNICDTTHIFITVIDGSTIIPPSVADDNSFTSRNASVVIDVCANDVIEGTITDFYILPIAEGGIGPEKGTAEITETCNILYTPNEDDCGADAFIYIACNEHGCDGGFVQISILCREAQLGLTIPTGFSPNGDGVNDFFWIFGLEKYPDHTLFIYNRWGNQVLKINNYQNDWDGTWNGSHLKDGTYYYIIDTGEGQQVGNYLQIQR